MATANKAKRSYEERHSISPITGCNGLAHEYH